MMSEWWNGRKRICALSAIELTLEEEKSMAFKTTFQVDSAGALSAASPGNILSDELKIWLKSEIDLVGLAENLFCTRWSEASGPTLPRGVIRLADLVANSEFAGGGDWVRFLCPWRNGADSSGFVVCPSGWYDHVAKEGGDAFAFVQKLVAYRRQIELSFLQSAALTIDLAEVADWDCENENERKMKQAALEFAAEQRMPGEAKRNEKIQTKSPKEIEHDYQHQLENRQ